MTLRSHTRTIGAHEYAITALPAWEGFAIVQQLIGLFGQAGAALVVGAVRSRQAAPGVAVGDLLDDDAAAGAVLAEMSNGTGLLARGLADPAFRAIAERLLNPLHVDKKLLDRDRQQDHFAENYGEMVGVIAFAMEANFRSFFSTGLAKGLLQRARAAGSQDQSNNPSGSSPGSQPSSVATAA